MNITFSTDDNFSKQLMVTIASILKNSNLDDEFNFYILDGGISVDNKNRIEKLKKIKNFKIEYLKINEDEFKNFPIYGHFKIPTYYRIKLPFLLNLDKILYLDCDIIVKKSLKALYNQELGDCYAICVEDFLSDFDFMKKHKKSLSLEKYFNAGVLLLNLKKMRRENIEEKCFDFVKNNSSSIKYVDQCILNKIFNLKVKFVENIWNFQYNNKINDISKKYDKCKKDIVILHFASPYKPWNNPLGHKLAFDWYYYLSFCGYNAILEYLYEASFYIMKRIKVTLMLRFC